LNPRIRSPKDFCAALIYLTIGLGTIYIGRDYKMGTALQMGPAYFPTVLGGLLAFIGAISLIRSLVRKGEPIPAFAWKPLLSIVAATVVFGLVVKGVGLVIALPLFVLMTAQASVKFRWGPALALAAGTTVFCSLVFVKGLGVPLPLIGRWFAGLLA
jgi:putative tricarboxylic transport membrane protein